jgi:hypothetical protein
VDDASPDKDSAKTGAANRRHLRGPDESFKEVIISVARADGKAPDRRGVGN